MTTDELIMQEMLDRATNSNRETTDEISSEMFCMLVKNNTLLIQRAQEMIVAKISSGNVVEAIRAIGLLEDCMRKCGPEFQDEVAKNRFLNNFIRLVLKKYEGNNTPLPIKQRILECLLLWTTEYADKAKIRIVYDLLAKEGDVELLSGNPSMLSAHQMNVFEKRESILGEDEDLLRVLLSSNDKEDLKRANMLIQARVKQDSRRTELLLQRKSKLQEVQETVQVLQQMLDIYEMDRCAGKLSDQLHSCDTMQELYYACKKHRPVVKQLFDMLDGTEPTDDSLRAETLAANDALRLILERYKALFNNSACGDRPAAAVAATPTTSSNADLLKDLLTDSPRAANAEPPLTATKPTALNTLDELHEIFADVATAPTDKQLNELFGNLDMLEPITLNAQHQGDTNQPQQQQQAADKKTFRGLPEIDELSEALLKQSLPTQERVITFKKEPEKLSLNDLVKERSNVKPTPATPTTTPTDADAELDDCMLLNDIVDDDDAAVPQEAPTPIAEKAEKTSAVEPVKHLRDITLDLDDVAPLEERLLLEDNDVKITLNFTANRPSREVSVIVLTVVNKSKSAIRDFQLEATVKKPSKVRLLKATADCMDPCRAFRPPPLINQMMLLLNPTQQAVDVSCIVSYKLGDDPDALNELLVVKDIPYVQ